MADFNITGEDKLLNYERLSPSFAVFKPLQIDLPQDAQQTNISLPTYQPSNYFQDLPIPDTDFTPKEPVEKSILPKSQLDSLKEIRDRIAAKQPIYQTPSSFSNRSLKDQLAAVESNGGNYKAYNSKGGGEGAVGKYQFRWTTWKPDIKKVTGITNKEDFMNNPQAQEQYFDHYQKTVLQPQMQQIKRQFPDSGRSDMDILKLLHFQGYEGAKTYLRTGNDKPQTYNTSISKYLSAR